MAKPHRHFTQELQDLGIGLSTLRHWTNRRRERQIERPRQWLR